MTTKQTRQRAALDRILKAVLQEEDAGGIGAVVAWLQYTQWRDEARIMAAQEGDCRQLTPCQELNNQFEAMLDDPKDEVYEQFDRINGLAERLDSGFRKPIVGQADWLAGDIA